MATQNQCTPEGASGTKSTAKTRRDMRERTRELAFRIIKLYAALPKQTEAQVIGKQMLRCGTAVGANYREGLRARSKSEYAAKLNVSLMEAEETLYWLELLEGAGIVSASRLTSLESEMSELMAILVTLIKKAGKQGPVVNLYKSLNLIWFLLSDF
jgi:four helix bundle protein